MEEKVTNGGGTVANSSNTKGKWDPFNRGCNATYNTGRSKLQQKRSRLNDDIIKELRLRRGAENLFRATKNKEIKEKVIIELGFVQSKLDVLKGDLAQLNSNVKTYQNENSSSAGPMLTLGLKETKDANFGTVFMNYIEDHYSEPSSHYTQHLDRLQALRKAIRTPDRSEAGVELLLTYYNQLSHIQKRFYPPSRSVPIYFTWYDSLTGIHTSQKTLGFEKGSVLFNIGALYSQLGTAQDRSCASGLDEAIQYYQKSAGILQYLRDRFANAPSLDMHTESLTLLIQLMLSQGQECVYEKMVMSGGAAVKFSDHIRFAQEAAMVSHMYEETHNAVASKSVRNDVPASWLTMTMMKCNHYLALAHYYLASALMLSKELLPVYDEITKTLETVTVSDSQSDRTILFDKDPLKQIQYCRSHLNHSVSLNETAQKDYSFCQMLRTSDDVFMKILSDAQASAQQLLDDTSSDKDYEDMFVTASTIVPKTKTLVQVTLEKFTDYPVEDFFNDLGPVSVFSAQKDWTTPRTVELTKDEKNGFGFTIMGDNPSVVVAVETDSSAEKEELKKDDVLVAVNGVNAKFLSLKEIKAIILKGGDKVSLTVLTLLAPKELPPPQISNNNPGDTIKSSASNGSNDMQQMGDTMTGTWRKKMKNLTFLKSKKSPALKESLRKQ